MPDQSSLFPQNETAQDKIVPVLLPMPLEGSFDYLVPDGQDLAPGTLVRVPLGPNIRTGVVWSKPIGTTKRGNPQKLKAIDHVVDGPPLTEDTLRFVAFVAAYTLSLPGTILRMVLSSREALEAPKTRRVVIDGDHSISVKMTPAREKLLSVVTSSTSEPASQLADRAGVSAAVITGLVKLGRLATRDQAADAPFPALEPRQKAALNTEQENAANRLQEAVAQKDFQPFLLDGVTGSGKTEVYYEAIAEAIKDPSAQILVLLPEIGLTTQWLSRFEARFGVRPAEWHSDVGMAERRRVWRAVHRGQAQLVVGARSALFLPFQNLSLIILDEEHDPSFKQEDGVLYHARDMAVVRAKEASCPLVLASATPSLESHINADQGRYERLVLKERYGEAKLPSLKSLDLKAAGLRADEWLTPPLVEAIEARITRGEQSLLFLNRRGYAPLTLCRACGHRFGCPKCSTWLVDHRFQKKLICHQCGHEEPKPEVCPSCNSTDTLAACGPGVERLEEEVRMRFPDARVEVLTSDIIGGPKRAKAVLKAIESGELDIIIGTQLITKGYHFPNLTLVGVIDADLGLNGGDLRAGERTFQQMEQVAGRAGRAKKAGEVYLQTTDPAHPVMTALIKGDRDGFLAAEAEDRRMTGMPPFGRLAGIILSGEDDQAVLTAGRLLAGVAPAGPEFTVFGPAPAPLARLRGQFRVRLLVKGERAVKLQPRIRAWLADFYRKLNGRETTPERRSQLKQVRIKVDIDPYSFL